MPRILVRRLWCTVLWVPLCAHAQPPASAVEDAIRRFSAHHASLADKPHDVNFLSVPLKAEPCAQPLQIASGSARLRGKVMFRVRCPSAGWSASVAARVVLPGEYWVASRFVAAGKLIEPEDLRQESGDLAAVPEDVVRSESLVLGQLASRTFQEGAPLVLNGFRKNTVVKAGERVKVNLLGSGFAVTGEATALAGGAVGEGVKLKTPDGQQLTGRVIKAGLVEVRLD